MKKSHSDRVIIDGYHIQDHPSYNSWVGLKSRCNNLNHSAYKNYGGRGIKYCAEWEHFINFCKDMGIRPSNKHSIERVDNDKGYSPANCIWATRSQQSINRRKAKNNTTGFVGVIPRANGRYIVVCYRNNQRYFVSGSFETKEKAAAARQELEFNLSKNKSIDHLLQKPARDDCISGVRGISKINSRYRVRWRKNGVTKNIGRFSTLNEAKRALEKWIKQN